MNSGTSAHRVPPEASSLLATLLAEEYRSSWTAYARRTGQRPLNHLAIATVLATHLNRHPQRDGDESVTAHQIHDTVSRALTGRGLARDRVEAFIDAFRLREAHARELRALADGQAPPNTIRGLLPPAEGGIASPGFRTVQLQEFHYIGPNRRPVRHRTVQVILALRDAQTTHRYNFDTFEATVERVHGGMPGVPFHVHGSIYGADIRLPRTLNAGETTSLEYVTNFQYSGEVPPCFRRVAHGRIENVAIRVEFHPECLPRQVWWAIWQDYRPPNEDIIHREPVNLDREYAVHRHLDVIQDAVAGFVWEF